MGWTSGFRGKSKSDVIADQWRNWNDGTKQYTFDHIHQVKDGAWCRVRVTLPDGTVERQLIAFLLMEKHGSEWAVKHMDESCGPYHYDCPASLLRLVPYNEASGEYAKNWRAKCQAHHAAKNTPDIEYYPVDNSLVAFRSTTEVGKQAIEAISKFTSGTCRVFKEHVKSVLSQLRKAGYRVHKTAG